VCQSAGQHDNAESLGRCSGQDLSFLPHTAKEPPFPCPGGTSWVSWGENVAARPRWRSTTVKHHPVRLMVKFRRSPTNHSLRAQCLKPPYQDRNKTSPGVEIIASSAAWTTPPALSIAGALCCVNRGGMAMGLFPPDCPKIV
jgi:hypothetical protein